MPHKYFCEELTPDAQSALLTGDEARHMAVVLRAQPGDAVVLCDGRGSDYDAVVRTAAPGEVWLDIRACAPCASEPDVQVTLYVGYPKQEKLEHVIQKATELGAVRVVPFFSRFCVAKPKNEEQKNARYRRIALEAAKQSGRGTVPDVALPVPFAAALAAAAQADAALFCWEAAAGRAPLRERLAGGVRTVAILTGSEGGFSPEEARQALDAGCAPLSLGPRILRCETAPLAALAAVMTLTGNLE